MPFRTILGTLILFFLFTASPVRAALLNPVELKCEYSDNPLGIDVVHPRLSWVLESNGRAQSQSAYRILAARDPRTLGSGKGDLWDSGKVRSDQSIQIPYAGKTLDSGRRCYWRVQVWNQDGQASNWSAVAWWEMGLLHPEDWLARWISAPQGEVRETVTDAPSPYLRKTFSLAGPVKSARAYICGLGYYELSLNGKRVGDHVLDPNQTDYDRRTLHNLAYPIDNLTTRRALYVSYDVTANLQKGDNVVGVALGNGWYNQRARRAEGWMWYGPPKMILQLEILTADGRRLEIVSDDSWKSSTGPITENQIFIGETYDARKEKTGWDSPGYDDSRWGPVRLVDAPSGALQAQASPPDKVVETITPAAVTHPSADIVRYDMGQNIAGWVRLHVQGPKGTVLALRFSEEQGEDYGQTDSYILKGEGQEIWEPRFTWHGFRVVDITGVKAGVTIDSLEGRVVHSAVAESGTFTCSDPLLNQIQKNYVRTQLCNMHGGVPSDCPHRERLGYTGDGQITAEAAIYNLDMGTFYTKWIEDIGDAQNPLTGFVPHTAPFQGGGGGPAWGSAAVLMPWYMYLYYGDTRLLAAHYAGMKRWVEYLGAHTDGGGIVVREEPGGWCLGDWCTPDKITLPPELVNTCYYARCAGIVAEAAAVLGRAQDHIRFRKLAADIAANMNRRFLGASPVRYALGRQGADAFPLAFGLTPSAKQAPVFDDLIRDLQKESKEHLDTGILATPPALDLLCDRGQADLAYTVVRQPTLPGYGYSLSKGATTLWENWDGSGSHFHPMFGSVSAWFYSRLAGINPDPGAPGFKHILIRPEPPKALAAAGAEYRSIRGKIVSRWTRENGGLRLDLEIPANTTATVFLPATDPSRVMEGKTPARTALGVRFLRREQDRLVYEVGSGRYEFQTR